MDEPSTDESEWVSVHAFYRDDLDHLVIHVERHFTESRLVAHLPGERVATVLDLCAHLICNRLGVNVIAEGAVRKAAAEAVAVLVKEGG